MRKCTSVNNDSVMFSNCSVNGCNNFLFRILLHICNRHTMCRCSYTDRLDVVGQRCGAVDLGFTSSEKIEIGPVNDQN